MTLSRRAGARISVWAPAKVNLALEVLARREDGYHELATIFQEVSLWDRVDIALTQTPEVSVAVRPPDAVPGPPEENLVLRAAEGLLQRLRESSGASSPGSRRGSGSGGVVTDLPGVRIVLTKRIPIGAGLGGGSSDAAATLLGLSRLLGEVGLPTPDLSSLAPKLGADVPFFLEGGIRLGTGVGEILRPLPPCPWRDLVLVFPNVGVSTGSVFQRWETGLTLPGPLARMAGLEIPRTFWEQDVDGFRNDLEPIVSVAYPVVDEILSEFRRLGSAFARMSGSGSTVFGVATDRVQAREWAGSFRRRGFWARAVRPGNRGCRVR